MDCDQTQSLCRQLNIKLPSLTTFPNTQTFNTSSVSTTKVNRYIGFNFYYTEVEWNCLLWFSNNYHRKPETAPDTGHQLIIVLIVPSAAHHNGAIICFTSTLRSHHFLTWTALTHEWASQQPYPIHSPVSAQWCKLSWCQWQSFHIFFYFFTCFLAA